MAGNPLWYALDVPPSQVVLVHVQWRTPTYGTVTYVWRLDYEDIAQGPEIARAILMELWYRWDSGELDARADAHFGPGPPRAAARQP